MPALTTSFPNAVGLRCFIHKRKNIEDHLKGVPTSMKKELLHDIFGVQDGDVFNAGLVDVSSEEDFDTQLKGLHQRWVALVPGFHAWFVSHQSSIFRRYIIARVRELALLGSPPAQFTNNSNESANSVLKNWTSYRKSSWPEFISQLQNLVESQLSEVNKAFYGAGDYSLAPEYSGFEVDTVQWHRMTAVQRKSHIQKMTTSLSTCAFKSPNTRRMSVPSSDVELASLSKAACKSMWEKAERLLITPGSIALAPGMETARMVASDSSSRPHFVRQFRDWRFACDDQCPMWRGRKICSHTVAVAESVGRLPDFLCSLHKTKAETNLTSLLLTPGEKKVAGTKSGKPARKGGANRRKVAVTSYENRIDTVCGSSEAEKASQSACMSQQRSPPSSSRNSTPKGTCSSVSIHAGHSITAGGSINVGCTTSLPTPTTSTSAPNSAQSSWNCHGGEAVPMWGYGPFNYYSSAGLPSAYASSPFGPIPPQFGY